MVSPEISSPMNISCLLAQWVLATFSSYVLHSSISGLHRYVILIYKQPGPLSIEEPAKPRSTAGRASWKANDFAAKYNLGSPVAANFVQAEWDDYVPKLYESLGS